MGAVRTPSPGRRLPAHSHGLARHPVLVRDLPSDVGMAGPLLPSHRLAAPQKLRVLIVEDEPLLRWALSETLVEAGHTVFAAVDAASALHAVEEAAPRLDAILLDYRLPDSSDLGLLGQLRQRAPTTSVVLMTACNTPELTDAARALGAYRVVDKPFDMRAIEACLRAACEAHAH